MHKILILIFQVIIFAITVHFASLVKKRQYIKSTDEDLKNELDKVVLIEMGTIFVICVICAMAFPNFEILQWQL